MSKKRDPTTTWSPWKPVAIKKVDPNTLSANLNSVSIYSIACRYVKYNPKITVIDKPSSTPKYFLLICLWCAYVTVAPDVRSTAVFSRGIENGLRALTPIGGQIQPRSKVGAKDLWKNVQKNALKNITSDVMNNIIPHSNPRRTLYVWDPE